MANRIEPTFVSVLEKFNCSICTNVLNEPVLTECCGQNFCKNCLENWFKRARNCPHCRKVNFKYIKNRPLEREINDLDIYCLNRNHGCDKVLPRGTLDKHLTTCEFAEVPCTNECGVILLRKDLQQHCQHTCPQRKIQCHLCGEIGTHKDITTTHQTSCPDMAFDCPRGCGASRIKRKNLQAHTQKCPLEPVPCPFFEVGCKDKLLRKNLDAHTASSTQQHLQLVMVTSTTNKAEYVSLKNKFDGLVSCVSQEIESLSLMNSADQAGLQCIKTAMTSSTIMLGPDQGKYCLHFSWDSDTSLRTPSFYLRPGYKMYLRCDREYGQRTFNDPRSVMTPKKTKRAANREFYTFYLEKSECGDHLPWPIQDIEVEVSTRQVQDIYLYQSKPFVLLLCNMCDPRLNLGPVDGGSKVRPVLEWEENGRYLARAQNPKGFYAYITLREHACTRMQVS